MLIRFSPEERHHFLKMNLLAAAKEKKPEILRKIFLEFDSPETLHNNILNPTSPTAPALDSLSTEPQQEQELKDPENFLTGKTILAWAEENNDVYVVL